MIDYGDNEDAGDLSMANFAGYIESLSEDHESGEHEGKSIAQCPSCKSDEDDELDDSFPYEPQEDFGADLGISISDPLER